jgi:hypothetical protein
MGEPVNILAFGACLVQGPLIPIQKVGDRLTYAKYGPIPPSYTFGIMLQTIAMWRGERDVPAEIRPLGEIRLNVRPVARASTFSDVDVAILEPASPIEITYRGCSLNRVSLYKLIVEPIRAIGPEASKAAMTWYRNGVDGLNPTLRSEVGRRVVELLPADWENREFVASVILETTSSKSDILGGFKKMRELLGRPMGVVAYVFQYLPDGRAVSWPAGFLEDIRDAAHQLGLPMLEPAEHVVRYPGGVAKALKPDMRHYSDEFNAVMGDIMVDFCVGIRDRARSFAAA